MHRGLWSPMESSRDTGPARVALCYWKQNGTTPWNNFDISYLYTFIGEILIGTPAVVAADSMFGKRKLGVQVSTSFQNSGHHNHIGQVSCSRLLSFKKKVEIQVPKD